MCHYFYIYILYILLWLQPLLLYKNRPIRPLISLISLYIHTFIHYITLRKLGKPQKDNTMTTEKEYTYTLYSCIKCFSGLFPLTLKWSINTFELLTLIKHIFMYSWFHIKGAFSVHSMRTIYISLSVQVAGGTFFMKSPVYCWVVCFMGDASCARQLSNIYIKSLK